MSPNGECLVLKFSWYLYHIVHELVTALKLMPIVRLQLGPLIYLKVS